MISWLSTVDGKGKLLMRKIGIDGEVGSIKVIDEVSTERSTVFLKLKNLMMMSLFLGLTIAKQIKLLK